MKAKVSLKMFVLSAALLIASFTASARNNDGQLIYNPIEENGMTVGRLQNGRKYTCQLYEVQL
jgi:hypothetical protein